MTFPRTGPCEFVMLHAPRSRALLPALYLASRASSTWMTAR